MHLNPAALVVEWSRRRRFDRGVALARPFAGRRVLDYGCGDGSFLGLLQTDGAAPALAVGVDIDGRLVLECQPLDSYASDFCDWALARVFRG